MGGGTYFDEDEQLVGPCGNYIVSPLYNCSVRWSSVVLKIAKTMVLALMTWESFSS